MVDEETQNVSGAPPNRDARRDPKVIEGEIAARAPDESECAGQDAAHADAARPRPLPAAEPPRAGFRALLAGALAGLIASALAVGAGYTRLATKADVADNASRLAEVEARAQRENAAREAEAKRDSAGVLNLDKRLGALEAGAGGPNVDQLSKRVAALEAANAENGPNAAAAAQAAQQATQTDQQLATQVRDLRADVDAARGEIPALAARVAKLETASPKTSDADLSILSARLDKVEAALAAPKSKTRVAPDARAPVDNAAATAIIAAAIADKLGAGAPFGPELDALGRLDVDPAALAALQGVAGGAPTGSSLAISFDAVEPRVLAAASHEEEGGVVDRFLAHVRGLVHVRDLNETQGTDPQAIASRIEADSRRGDAAGALAAFNQLPEAARQAAGDWAIKAHARLAADAALQSIREAAIGRLTRDSKQ
jgi:hypothetical protein